MSNIVEEDNIYFETIVSQNVLSIPVNKNNAKTPIQLGVRVTNLSSNPYRFSIFYLGIELKTVNGHNIQLEYARNATRYPEAADFPLIELGKNFAFLLNADLYWIHNTLVIGGRDKSGGFWTFRNLNPGTYQVQFTYKSEKSRVKLHEGGTIVEGIWIGIATTPFVELRLTHTIMTK